MQAGFDRAYAGRHDAFKAALLDARDDTGRLLAGTWQQLGWNLTFDGVAAAMSAVDDWPTGGAGRNLLIENLARRGIGIGFRGGRLSYSEGRVPALSNPGEGLVLGYAELRAGDIDQSHCR